MRRGLAMVATVVLLGSPRPAPAEDARAPLERAALALGAGALRTLEYSASGVSFAIGQSVVPGAAWPRFNILSFTRAMNYETVSLRDEQVRSRAETPPRGGGVPTVGIARQVALLSGDLAWNLVGEGVAPAPVALVERQFQLWTTPHGVLWAAMANNATVQGRTIAFAVPGRYTVRATLDGASLVQK